MIKIQEWGCKIFPLAEGMDVLLIQIAISRGKEWFGIHLQPLLAGLWRRKENSMFLQELFTMQTTSAI
jgi:hypothetical protein